MAVLISIQFMGLSYVPAVACGLVLVVGILAQIGQALDDMDNIGWIPGGWSVASAVSFAIAGGLSDIFGRRYVLIGGQVMVLIGAVSLPCLKLPLDSKHRQLIVFSFQRLLVPQCRPRSLWLADLR